ncbi:hypothetical protein AB0L62_14705 [Nocardia asteroides]
MGNWAFADACVLREQRLEEFLVELDIESAACELAAREWDRQLAEFPLR